MQMKLAVLSSRIQGEIDRLLSENAARLQAGGAHLAGVVKVLEENPADAHACDMDLRVLPDGPQIRITQSLGSGATGCRLNPSAIAEAVAAVEQNSADASDLFILNKFGPQESEGHGFCAAIGAALEQDIPVLVGVGGSCRDAFDAFADGMAEVLPPDREAIHKWCVEAMAESRTA
jgi:Protein of unknown function (DUF2478)